MGLLLIGLGLCVLAASTPPATAAPVTGVYRITPRSQQGMALDVNAFGNTNGTTVQIWTANKTSNQQWLVEKQADASYKIYAYSGQNSLQMLDLTNGVTTTGTPVKTYQDNGDTAQRWLFQAVGGGWYRIVPQKASGTAQTLEVVGGTGAGAGAALQIGAYSTQSHQLFRLDWAGVTKVLPSPKKGLAGRPPKAASMHCSWYYTWGGDKPADHPKGLEFVPMEWGYYGNADNASVNWLNWVISQPGVTTMLGFNEPDNTGQANLTVAYALEGWQYMAQLGIPVGSPATVHADNQWMKDFMSGCAQRGYRVDYVTIHWYGGADASGFLGHVDYVHNLYGKPVWITEFAPADWSGNRGISPQQCADFMRVALPGLASRSYVQRYSWFSSGTGDAALGAAALVNDDGTLTDLGKLYSRF